MSSTIKINTPTATTEEIIDTASEIWSKVKKSTQENKDSLFMTIKDEHKNFTMTFPIVVKYMIFMDQYSKKAFTRFLKVYAMTEVKTKDIFLEMQAKYLRYLYMELNPHYTEKEINYYESSVLQSLKEDDAKFTKIATQIYEESDSYDRQELIKQIKQRLSIE